MKTALTQKDVLTCFAMAAAGRDAFDFFDHILVEEIDTMDGQEVAAANVAERVLDVMAVLTHKPIADTRKIAEEIAFYVLENEKDNPNSTFMDTLLETCQESWEHGLKELKLDETTTLKKIVADRPKFSF